MNSHTAESDFNGRYPSCEGGGMPPYDELPPERSPEDWDEWDLAM